MITKQTAEKCRHGDIMHHIGEPQLVNADGSPVRIRVTGMCKTWKTRPNDFKLPVKHGMFGPGFYITPANMDQWEWS